MMMKHIWMTGVLLTALLVMAARLMTAEASIIEALFKVAEVCTGDVARLCRDIVPGEGRIKACVRDKLSQLSPDCTHALAKMIAERTEPPPDCLSSAKDTRLDGLRGMRYGESDNEDQHVAYCYSGADGPRLSLGQRPANHGRSGCAQRHDDH